MFGIPSEEIAIKTAEINELRNIDLLSRECKIRYIITVNALKEGWDCPFAYILASISNKSSKIDVEQILGRILRQPYASRYNNPFLNMSYVLTSSNDFKNTLDNIVVGLNNSGFSKNDYRIAGNIDYQLDINNENNSQKEINEGNAETNDAYTLFTKDEAEKIKNEIKNRLEKEDTIFEDPEQHELNNMLQQAQDYNKEYEDAVKSNDENYLFLSPDLIDKTTIFKIKEEYKNIIKELKIPIFSIDTETNFFGDNSLKLTKDYLTENFELSDKPLPNNLSTAVEDIFKFDIRSDNTGSTPTYLRLNRNEITKFKKYLQEIPDESKKNACINVLCKELEKINYISKNEIRGYIDRIVGRMSTDELVNLENNVFAISYKIKIFIEDLVKKYRKDRFYTLSEKGIIKEKMHYSFPNEVSILDYTENITNSLYQAEKNDMNKTEFDILNIINSCDNILWWHRIKDRDEKDFYINGFINHYPDFMFMTKKGKIIVVEVKGEQLKNDESIDKLYLGRKWQQLAGDNYRYYMVFMNSAFENIEGTYDINKLCDIIKEL